MRTAVTDGLILASTCKVVGGGTERAAERPTASLAEVEALTTAMPDRFRLIVLLATWFSSDAASYSGFGGAISTPYARA